jgi:hypothetical protein
MGTITSTQTGNWHAPGTWAGGAVPANNDLVVIAHGDKVTLSTNIQAAITDDVTINGNLHFADGGKMHLNGRMTVKNTSNANNTAGEFVTDSTSSGSLLSMVGGTEIKISGDNSAQHGIQVDARAWCGVQIDGGEPTLNTLTNGVHAQESTYITVDNSANFAIGDLISIYKREEDFRLTNDECMFIHDVDTTNHRLYFKHFVSPKAVIQSVSGSTITVDNAKVFRVGYILIFGTGNNRNIQRVTAINYNSNVITFGSSIDNDPSVVGLTVYSSGNERYHLDNKPVRRLATTLTADHTGAVDLRTINVGSVSDLAVGDKIFIESNSETNYLYASGSETNHWRHRLTYIITAINSLVITVDRDILYDGIIGCLVSKMTRDVVIKACATNGDDVAYADQDTARVFFNVKYWTSNSWNAAPTRRVKIKYVEFDGLGYNTADGTNFRQGVNIAGYNGYYDTKITGAAEDNTTIHASSGVSQTGENYLDGCSYTAYNLYSNTTRDGDDYGSICTRHPWGIVLRNCVVVGAGRGIWHWSSHYYVKSTGHIVAACNYTNTEIGSAYEKRNDFSYMTLRMSEDYGLLFYHTGRQNSMTTMEHWDIQLQNRVMHTGSYHSFHAFRRRWYLDKYKNIYLGDGTDSIVFEDSQFMPNKWDVSRIIYGIGGTPLYDTTRVRHEGSGHRAIYLGETSGGRVVFPEHGFKVDEHVELNYGVTRLNRNGNAYDEWITSNIGPPSANANIWVPAGTTVKLRSRLKINVGRYDGASHSVSTNSLPHLFARPLQNCGFFGRHNSGVVTDSDTRTLVDQWDYTASNDQAGILNSTQTVGKIGHSFLEIVTHTASSVGAWETKDITVQPQYKSYFLNYGYYLDDNSVSQCGFNAMEIQVIFDKPSGKRADGLKEGTMGIKTTRSSFTANKKRISGRI